MKSQLLTAAACVLLLTGCAGYGSAQTTPAPPPEPAPEPRAERPDDRPANTAHLGIPPGHLPPPGECRIWIPGRPPGHQPRSGSCAKLEQQVPAGAWLVYRPSQDRHHVHVTVYDSRPPGYVMAVRLYEADTGRFVREE